jgi:hypothetical protein
MQRITQSHLLSSPHAQALPRQDAVSSHAVLGQSRENTTTGQHLSPVFAVLLVLDPMSVVDLYTFLDVPSDISTEDLEKYQALSAEKERAWEMLLRNRASYDAYRSSVCDLQGIIRVVGEIVSPGWYRLLGVVGCLTFFIPKVVLRVQNHNLTVNNVHMVFESAVDVKHSHPFQLPTPPRFQNMIWGLYDAQHKISRKDRFQVRVSKGGWMYLDGVSYIYESALIELQFVRPRKE